jgi:coenzyme PQQ biosynthesis protein PqqD
MNATARYRFARGVRLRAADCGEPMLLVPEGVVKLNETAAATLELVDGARDTSAIALALSERFDAEPLDLERDVRTLLAAFVARGFVIDA